MSNLDNLDTLRLDFEPRPIEATPFRHGDQLDFHKGREGLTPIEEARALARAAAAQTENEPVDTQSVTEVSSETLRTNPESLAYIGAVGLRLQQFRRDELTLAA